MTQKATTNRGGHFPLQSGMPFIPICCTAARAEKWYIPSRRVKCEAQTIVVMRKRRDIRHFIGFEAIEMKTQFRNIVATILSAVLPHIGRVMKFIERSVRQFTRSWLS